MNTAITPSVNSRSSQLPAPSYANSKHAFVVVAAALAVTTAFAGCTPSHNKDGSSSSAKGSAGSSASAHPSGSSASKSDAGLPSGVTGATSIPTKVANNVAMRKHVTMSSCEKADGGWSASGTATNPATTPVGYTITVFFTTAAATVVDTAQTHVDVAAGGKQAWTVTKKFHAAPSMRCVLVGVG
jgi:hypothetical protein